MRFVTTRCAHLETDWLLQDAFHKTAVGHSFAANYNAGLVITTTILLHGLQQLSGLERLVLSKVNVKAKFTPELAIKAQRGSIGIALLFL